MLNSPFYTLDVIACTFNNSRGHILVYTLVVQSVLSGIRHTLCSSYNTFPVYPWFACSYNLYFQQFY